MVCPQTRLGQQWKWTRAVMLQPDNPGLKPIMKHRVKQQMQMTIFCRSITSFTLSWHPEIFFSGFHTNWSCITTSPSHTSSAPPVCFPPGWMSEALQSRMSFRVSTNIRDSCCLGCCASTWIYKAPLKLERCHQIRAPHPCSPQRASQCTLLIFHLLLTPVTLSSAPESFWQVSAAGATALGLRCTYSRSRRFEKNLNQILISVYTLTLRYS